MSERSTRVAVDRTNSCINHDATCLVTIAAGPLADCYQLWQELAALLVKILEVSCKGERFVNVDTEVLE